MTLTQPQQLGCGLVQATFVTSSGILTKAWSVFSSRDERIVTREGNGLVWKVYEEQDLMVVAFEVQPGFDLKPDLVSASHLNKFPVFSVNRSAVLLFRKNLEGLYELKARINSSTRLIVAGHGLGGSVASLFTILLLGSIWLGKNRPLCITFGSPLIGDKNLQQAISRSYKWNSCFLHVVSLKDPLPRLFVANHSSSLTPQTIVYRPFGTFLFCSDVNSVCFENPDIILELLMARHPIHVQDQGFQSVDYLNLVKNLNQKAICKDLTTLAENTTHQESNSKLESSISIQLRALGLTPHMQQQQSIDIKTLEKMEQQKIIMEKRRRVVHMSFQRLIRMKIGMAQLEWYKKASKQRGGYYDSYKNKAFVWDEDTYRFVKDLTDRWEMMVSEADINPQKEDAAFRKRWIYAGTSYRRMVEPLVIAEYYVEGGKDYVTRNRPKHFVLLEKWFRNGMTKAKTSDMESDMEDICDLFFRMSVVDNCILSRQGSMVMGDILDWDRYWDEDSDMDEDEDYYCHRTVDDCLASSQGSKVDQEEWNYEDKLNSYIRSDDEYVQKAISSSVPSTTSKNSDEKCVNVPIADKNLRSTWKRNVELILTIDSCFWAHVEEACISCEALKVWLLVEKIHISRKALSVLVMEEKKETLKKLVEFEEYVYELLKKYEVSPEIFLPKSSYMRWWNEYKAIKGTSYDSKLASFMNDERNYEQYALGHYDFL